MKGFTHVLDFDSVTPDATPKDIGKIPVAQGELMKVAVDVIAREHLTTPTERSSYSREVVAYRNIGGNVTFEGAVAVLGTDIEVTATMDVTLAVDTTAQTIDIVATGVAGKNIAWYAVAAIQRLTEKRY